MKRSEMIKVLCEPIKIDYVDLWLFPAEAEVILQRIEQLGMLPPNNGRTFNISEGALSAHEWEEE